MQDNNPTNLENRTTTAEVENFTDLTSNQSHASLPSAGDVNLRHELTDLLLNGTAISAKTGGNNFKHLSDISNLKPFFSNISNPNNNSVFNISISSNTSNSTKSVNFLPVVKSPFSQFLQNQNSDHQNIGNIDIMNLANHGPSTPTVAGLTSDPNLKPTPEPDQTDALLSAFSMESWVLLGCIGVLGIILALIILIGSCILSRKRYKKPRTSDKRKENKSPKAAHGEKPTPGSSTSTETTTTTTSQSTDTSIPYKKVQLQIVNNKQNNKNINNNKRKEELKLDTPPRSLKSLSLEPAEREDLDPSADSKSGPVPRYEVLSDNGQESYEVILSSSGTLAGGSKGFEAKRYDRIKSPTPRKSGQLPPEELPSIQEESNGPNSSSPIGDQKKTEPVKIKK